MSFDSVSIAEIEYCILRAPMARSSIFTGMVIASPPQTIFPEFALTHRDFRLHYAINCGSLSLIETVPVYSPSILDGQLDEITRLSVDNFIEIDVNKRLVILPKFPFQDYASIPSVYAVESTNNNSTYSHSNVVECLRAILPYLPRGKRVALQQLLSQNGQQINVKFRAVNFKCRILKKANV